MKKFTFLLTVLLMVSLSAFAQIKMYLNFKDGTRVEYIASSVESITLSSQTQEPDDSDKPDANGHEYVDLGLSVKWATCNVGASSPEETGYFFSWGEIEPKSTYNWETYKWCNGSYDTMTKYCTSSSYGTVDNKTILELSDDAANVNWGGDWRMPTIEEQDELRTECTWTWITKNGVKGYTVTGPNGNSIFLPVAGYRRGSGLGNADSDGKYWSSSLYYISYLDGSSSAYCLDFNSRSVGRDESGRLNGFSVRPVLR